MKNLNIISDSLATAILIEALVRDAYGPKPSGAIQPLQWSVLRYLRTQPEHLCTMSLIRKSLRKTHAPVVRAIKTLVSKGLIQQVSHPNDARSKTLLLTETGGRVLEKDPILKLVKRFERLPKRDLQNLQKSVKKMARSLDADDVEAN